MNVFVCIKGVPDTSEAEIKVNPSGKAVDVSGMTFDINDADNYALEESVLIKETAGGSVQLVSIGTSNDEVMIRMALAKGGDGAIHIEDPNFKTKEDPLLVAKVLASVIKAHPFDLVLTGCMAADDGYTAVGVALAEELGVPHAAMVKKVEMNDGRVKVYRELEGGLVEVVDLALPAVLSIQTGINKPRFAALRGIRAAQKKEIKWLKLEDMELGPEDFINGSSIKLQRFYIPQMVCRAEIIEGEPEQKAEILADKMIKGGLL
jgi:electron transfer flavoprotein beta subunit